MPTTGPGTKKVHRKHILIDCVRAGHSGGGRVQEIPAEMVAVPFTFQENVNVQNGKEKEPFIDLM